MDELLYWIWLSISCTPDTSTFPKLLESFDSPKEIYDSDIKTISRCIGFKNSDRTLLENKDLTRATEIYEFCKKFNVGMLAYSDERYPQLLREIKTPPVLLYYRGTLPDFDRRFLVSAVGTRSLSDYGRRCAFKISHDLAKSGAIIVSGMAIGIDGVALAGAISAGATTVAVIGSGINICYPPQHQRLAREIVKNGCVLTEYPPNTPPSKLHFPKRNRIISGLSRATVIFEGRERSGVLITARYAMDQGRTLYALPGNVESKNSEVSNLLLKNGAKPCTSADDIVRDFSDIYPGELNPFELPQKSTVDMMGTLRELQVSALCPGDDVFVPTRTEYKKRNKTPHKEKDEAIIEKEKPTDASIEPAFDSKALMIYKKIPPVGACDIESLVDEQNSLREVMKCLLKLEVGKFIVMLPGERVARKTK